MKDHYKTLNISSNASADEIKLAYHRMAKKYHPDLNHSPHAENKFIEISLAYRALKHQRKNIGKSKSTKTRKVKVKKPFSFNIFKKIAALGFIFSYCYLKLIIHINQITSSFGTTISLAADLSKNESSVRGSQPSTTANKAIRHEFSSNRNHKSTPRKTKPGIDIFL